MRTRSHAVLALLASAALARTATADFSGQTILGPLTDGSIVTGNTSGRSDNNDGFDSGGHIFNIWDGGDDVWGINWLGGDLEVTLRNLSGGVDNDLFLYSPGSLDSTGDYSILGGNFIDTVTLVGAAPGFYYINVDSTFFSEGSYELTVRQVPTPGATLVLGAGALVALRRRR